jgi:hypothetical protein
MADTLPTIALPSVVQAGDPPSHVALRGQDVRAYDHEADRLVWGPAHPFLAPDDLTVMNGLWRMRFGLQGTPAAADVEVFRSGQWRDMGTLYFTDPASTTELLLRARLMRLTTELVTVALDIRDAGVVLVTLKRGERGVRITHGSDVAPTESRKRQVHWEGSPSGSFSNGRLVSAADGNGLIKGLAVRTSGYALEGTFGLEDTRTVGEFYAFVAVSGGTKDAAADHHAQYIGDGEQDLRVR